MSVHRRFVLAFAAVAVLTAAAAPLHAGSVRKSVPFELQKWWALDSTDGPVKLHRLQLDKIKGPLDKSALFRPGNSEYLETVQIKLEYTNESTRDWEADVKLVWKDADGKVIDGYHDGEGLDRDERNDLVTVTLSTLRYGIERAETLEIEIKYDVE